MLICAYKHMKKLTFLFPLALLCSVLSAQQDHIPNAPGVKVHPSDQLPEKRRSYTESSSPSLQDTAQSKFSGTPLIPNTTSEPLNVNSNGTFSNEPKPDAQQPKTKNK